MSVNNENFGNYIGDIYPSDLELKVTTLTSNEVCYLDTRIRNGDSNTPFHLSVYDKRDDFSFRIVNFPHIDSNIPANPAYGVYISQLVRYVRICTSKLDFIRRLRRLSSRQLLHQGFKSMLLRKWFTKFFKRHSAIIEKYGTALREIRLAIQNWETPPYPLLFQILYIILAPLFYFYIASIQFDAVARARNFP